MGKGLNNVELKVVNNEEDLVKPGELGRFSQEPSIMKGYWDDPIATEQVLKDGWLHTEIVPQLMKMDIFIYGAE